MAGQRNVAVNKSKLVLYCLETFPSPSNCSENSYDVIVTWTSAQSIAPVRYSDWQVSLKSAIQQQTPTELRTTQSRSDAQEKDITFQHTVILNYNVPKNTFTVRQTSKSDHQYNITPVQCLSVTHVALAKVVWNNFRNFAQIYCLKKKDVSKSSLQRGKMVKLSTT